MEESLPSARPDDAPLSLFAYQPVSAPGYRAPTPGDDDDERPLLDTPAQWAHCAQCPDRSHNCRPDQCAAILGRPARSVAEECAAEVPEPLVAPEAPLTPDQVTLFDLQALTVKVPGQEMQEQLEQLGASVGARKRVFEAAVIKQVVLYFQGDEYRQFLSQLEVLAAQFDTDSHTDTITAAVRHCLSEATHGLARPGTEAA